MKANLGCGRNLKNDWLNVDILEFSHENYIKANLVHAFPFTQESLEYAYSEHFLEHLDEVDGFSFMVNCFNSLKPKGVLRLSLPSLDKILDMYNDFDNQKNKNVWFLKFRNKEQFLNFVMFGESSTVETIKFNNNIFSTNDGHKYLYSKQDLFEKLYKCGFSQVYEVEKNESLFTELKNLETRESLNDITIEAIK